MGVTAKRVDSPATDGFTKTIKFKVLHCGNVIGNNNKYYCIELQYNPSTGEYRLFTHYGRLNSTNVYEVRGPYSTLSIAEKDFYAIIKKKLRGKKQGDEGRENYVEVDVVIPSVGSENIRGKESTAISSHSSTKPRIPYSHLNHDCQRIVKIFVDENVHAITSTTKQALKLTSRGFETPLGPVTVEHIDKAKTALDTIKEKLDPETEKADGSSRIVIDANNYYYSLIPHDLGRKIQAEDWILDKIKLFDEYELLEQLSSAVQAGTTSDPNDNKMTESLGFDITPLDDPDITVQIIESIRNTKADNHKGLDVWYWDVKKIFLVEVKKDRDRFKIVGENMKNHRSLFHGSKNQNCLSIMFNGLIIPPVAANGRAFGDGIYAASNSTKALNYSTGFWGGRTNKEPSAFLFITKFAMGKIYETTSSLRGGAPKGYDSVHAKASRGGYGGGLYNDELIVYKEGQSVLQYLVEMRSVKSSSRW